MQFSAQSADNLLLCGYYCLLLKVTHEQDCKNITDILYHKVNYLAVSNSYLTKNTEGNLTEILTLLIVFSLKAPLSQCSHFYPCLDTSCNYW